MKLEVGKCKQRSNFVCQIEKMVVTHQPKGFKARKTNHWSFILYRYYINKTKIFWFINGKKVIFCNRKANNIFNTEHERCSTWNSSGLKKNQRHISRPAEELYLKQNFIKYIEASCLVLIWDSWWYIKSPVWK